ncbi:hypothetical protein, partial [Phocaeicola abscessus]|uniref:hypothetical protein n=1 Tax=Phocaeicola abscessus TaxID=555313 RepID=UPI0028ED9379
EHDLAKVGVASSSLVFRSSRWLSSAVTKYQSVPVSFSTGCRGTQKIRIASFWGVPGEKLVPKAEEG